MNATCKCSPPKGESEKSQCAAGQQCQCPCYMSTTDYNYCSGHFTITDTTKICYPATLPLHLPDLASQESSVASTLKSCRACSWFTSENACTFHGCCYSAENKECTECQGAGHQEPDGTSSGSGSCGSLCLGLTISFVLAFVIIVVAVVVVVLWKRGYRPLVPARLHSIFETQPSSALSRTEDGLNTTVIQVNNSYEDDRYCRPESIIPQPEEPNYLTMDSQRKSSE